MMWYLIIMKISCPSKTFLCGEYAVIDGGPAILLATPPYFVLDHSRFMDPYRGAGGFGASGARFVLALKKMGYSDPWKVWEKYRRSGFYGSGADVVAQWVGGITFFHAEQKIIENLIWPFQHLLIALIHTGYKIQTHKHLQALNRHHRESGHPANFKSLESIVLRTYQALKQADQESFLMAVGDYAAELNQLNLVCDHTGVILSKMKGCPYILASKGCGALGADVILAVIEKTRKDDFFVWADQEKLKLVFCDNQFAGGVSCV